MHAGLVSVLLHQVFSNMERFDFNLLAQISEGYTGGAIQKAIRRTLTPRRLEKLDRQALQEAGTAAGHTQADNQQGPPP